MKINTPKCSAAQLRKREAEMLEELCDRHSYFFSIKVPKNEQSTTIVQRRGGGKYTLRLAVVAKVIVPVASKLGAQIIAHRARLAREAKERKGRPKMRALHKIGPGPK